MLENYIEEIAKKLARKKYSIISYATLLDQKIYLINGKWSQSDKIDISITIIREDNTRILSSSSINAEALYLDIISQINDL